MSVPSAPPAYDAVVNEDKKYGPQFAHSEHQTAPGNPPYPYTAYPPNPSYNAYPPNPSPQPYNETSIQNPNPLPIVSENVQPSYQPPSSNNPEVAGFTTRRTFDDKSIRRVFIRKVFAVLSVQLLITFGFVCLFLFVTPIQAFVRKYKGFYYAAFGVFLVFYFILICSASASRKYPRNLIMLSFLTLALSYMVGAITTTYSVQAVVIGIGVTVLVCITVMLFSIQTKFDFTKCGGLLFVLCMVLFIFGFITIFTYGYLWYIHVVYGSLGALVFTLFLAYDTQLVMGGRKYELDPEEYVFGALSLYIDIVYIFLFLLSIFGGSS